MSTALVIDDNQQMADSLCKMLRFFGVQAFPAYGPRGAMVALTKFVPDIIFIDINMPGVDGFEVMGYVRRMPQLDHTPMVVVTSDDQEATAQKAHKTGALFVVIKPVTLDVVESVLKKTKLIG
jgi:CheY-like chemotaxis protein